MWKYKTAGIPDEFFERNSEIPITKEEIRVIQISKGHLCSGNTVYDIGCGSGSISIETALQIGQTGIVYAIDFNSDAVELTKKNLKKFNISNVSVIYGNAKEKILDLPEADTIFVGGTGGDTKEILELCNQKLKKGGRIVIGIILIETLFSVIKTIESLDFGPPDISQIMISKSRKTSYGTMMLARNPITIISATKI